MNLATPPLWGAPGLRAAWSDLCENYASSNGNKYGFPKRCIKSNKYQPFEAREPPERLRGLGTR